VVVSVRARRVVGRLALVAGLLVGVSVVLGAIKATSPGTVPESLVDLFRLNEEGNLPAFYSGVLLLTSAALLGAVSWNERRVGLLRSRVWLALAVVFVFLAYDELFSVHERLIEPMRRQFELPSFLQFAWVPIYAGIVVIVAIAFFRLWRELPRNLRRLFAAAAVIYLSGAVGFEMLGAARYTGAEGDMVYGLLYTTEETLEMAGLIVLIYSLLSVLAMHPLALTVGSGPSESRPPVEQPSLDAPAISRAG
jgi:hypothetical protein